MAPPRKTARQEREELSAKKAGIVERRIELGRELAELHDVTPNNRRFGAIVRQRFDLHDANEVSEMMRVARVYGGRSEIYRAVGWRALVELASQATSDEERQKFEAKILAGEPTNGAELIRAREAREQSAAKSEWNASNSAAVRSADSEDVARSVRERPRTRLAR